MKLIRSFLTDEDGFSAKDFLMVTFGTIFILMLVTAFIISLVGVLPVATISVIQLMDGVIITIVGGVFGIQGIREFKGNGAQQNVQPTVPNEVKPNTAPRLP